MNIGLMILIIFECVIGVSATLYIVASMFVVAFQKIYRRVKFHTPLYD